MKNKALFILIVSMVLSGISSIVMAQDTNQETIYITDIFDGKKAEVCIHNIFIGISETKEAYKIRDYYISVTDISQKQADTLLGKKVVVSGKLLIYKGDFRYERTGSKGQLVKKIVEPDLFFINEPIFSVIYETREPLIKE